MRRAECYVTTDEMRKAGDGTGAIRQQERRISNLDLTDDGGENRQREVLWWQREPRRVETLKEGRSPQWVPRLDMIGR